MLTVRTLAALRAEVRAWRAAGQTVALVPTMGALHAGHVSLLNLGRARAARTVASIFVNPMQFDAADDLARYPRDEASDTAMLEACGCALLFAPDVATVYPPGFATRVRAGPLGDRLEGAARPGHFDGVATVVTKLLNMVQPDIAIFGEKDWQQLAVVRRLVLDLDMAVEIVGAPVVRDSDGVALSSRNALLSVEDRARAVALPRVLEAVARTVAGGAPVAETLSTAVVALRSAGFAKVDYLQLVDERSLEDVDSVVPGARLVAAARIGGVRLLDTMAVEAVG